MHARTVYEFKLVNVSSTSKLLVGLVARDERVPKRVRFFPPFLAISGSLPW